MKKKKNNQRMFKKKDLSTHISPDTSTPRSTTNNFSILTQSPLGERFPQCAEILSTSELLVSEDNSITGIKEGRLTGLELHSVEDESINGKVR